MLHCDYDKITTEAKANLSTEQGVTVCFNRDLLTCIPLISWLLLVICRQVRKILSV